MTLPPPAPLYLGIDVGTSGVKVLLIDASGDIQRSSVAPLSLSTPRPAWAEQDPDAWWQASLEAIADVLRAAGGATGARVASIGISGQMHSAVFLDRGGKGIRPALLWGGGRTGARG